MVAGGIRIAVEEDGTGLGIGAPAAQDAGFLVVHVQVQLLKIDGRVLVTWRSHLRAMRPEGRTLWVIDFWYQPASPQNDGLRRMFWNNASGVGQDCFVFEKTTADTLRFSIVVDASNANCTSGGTTYSATVPAAQFAWQPGQWIHLQTKWSSSGGGLLEIYVNGILKAQSIGYRAVGVTHGQTHFGGCPGAGTCPIVGGDAHADRVIDEPTIYVGFPNPNRLAVGGLTASPDEYLADPAKNWPLNFLSIDAGRRGSYLYLGADSKFRGLNVALAQAGPRQGRVSPLPTSTGSIGTVGRGPTWRRRPGSTTRPTPSPGTAPFSGRATPRAGRYTPWTDPPRSTTFAFTSKRA